MCRSGIRSSVSKRFTLVLASVLDLPYRRSWQRDTEGAAKVPIEEGELKHRRQELRSFCGRLVEDHESELTEAIQENQTDRKFLQLHFAL